MTVQERFLDVRSTLLILSFSASFVSLICFPNSFSEVLTRSIVSARALHVGVGALYRSFNVPESLKHPFTGILYRLLNIAESVVFVVHILFSFCITFGVVRRIGNSAAPFIGDYLSSLGGIVITHSGPSTF